MSLVETDKLILLISDLDELLSSWNVTASDAYDHTLKLKIEDLEVYNLAEKDNNLATVTKDSDAKAIEKSTWESEKLIKMSDELHKLTEPLPERAKQRVRHGQNTCRISQQYIQKSNDWLSVATRDLRRAEQEYNIAENEYIEQQARYESAESKFYSTSQYIYVSVSDSEGRSHTEKKINPAWESAKAEVYEQKAELDRCEQILVEKRKIKKLATEQSNDARRAMNLSNIMLKNSRQLLEKAIDLQEWSNNAYRSASYALSAAKSALNFDNEAKKQNEIQLEFNDDIGLLFYKIKLALNVVVVAVQKVAELTDSCNGMNIQFSTSLEGKTNLLHKMSTILPDEFQPFIVE